MANRDHKAALADLVSQIEQSAYKRGWEDAIQHVVSAASQAAEPMSRIRLPTRNTDQKRKASYGAVPMLTGSAIRDAGDRGVTPLEVVAFGQSRDEEIAESSVRRELGRLVKDGTARKQGGRYFLVQEQRDRSGEETGDAVTSPSDTEDDDGGYHAAA